MLAEKRFKKKFSDNPNGHLWSKDSAGLGKLLLAKSGWKEGDGLGKNRQGITEPIKAKAKFDSRGLGCNKTQSDEGGHQQIDAFSDILKSLNEAHGVEEVGEEITMSLEKKSEKSSSRLHYAKFTRAKDVSRYKIGDMACIFGRETAKGDKKDTTTAKSKGGDETESSSFGVMTVTSGLSSADYFKQKMASLTNGNSDLSEKTKKGKTSISSPDKVETSQSEATDTTESFGVKTVTSGLSTTDYFKQKMASLTNADSDSSKKLKKRKKSSSKPDQTSQSEATDTTESESFGVKTVTSGLSTTDYFKQKMASLTNADSDSTVVSKKAKKRKKTSVTP